MTEKVLFKDKEIPTVELPIVKAEKSTIEVLQEIRQEIDQHREGIKIMTDDDWYAGKLRGYDCVIEIIDKHIKQIEGSDTE